MDTASEPNGAATPWKGDQAPCVYCGQVIARSEERCPHCRTSFSLAVRKASREVIGPWYYLDPRNPSGRGVTFETLIKMIEKGRIRPDSVVRGPTTRHDWLFAAETPRLAKYLGMCPHCFAPAKPEDAFCTSCQLNMNQRPADPRPGIPADLVKEPFHKAAYDLEKQLAQAQGAPVPDEAVVTDTPPAGPAVAAPVAAAAPVVAGMAKPTPRPEPAVTAVAAAAAAAAAASTSAGTAERPSRVAATAPRKKPQFLIVLGLTWATLIPLALLVLYTDLPLWFTPSSWHEGINNTKNRILGATPPENEPAKPPASAANAWVNEQLKLADRAVAVENFTKAIEVYQAIMAKTGETVWQARVDDLQRKIVQKQQAERLAKLKERLETADTLARASRHDEALTVLGAIPAEDRKWLDSVGVSVAKMEEAFRQAKAMWAEQKKQEDQLAAEVARAAQLAGSGQVAQALEVFKQVRATFPLDLIRKHVDIDKILQSLEKQLAAVTPQPQPPQPQPTPPKPPTPAVPPDQVAAAIADLLTQAAALEKGDKFAESLAKLEEVKQKFEQQYWPATLDDLIQKVKAKKEALEFFGMDPTPKPKPKAP